MSTLAMSHPTQWVPEDIPNQMFSVRWPGEVHQADQDNITLTLHAQLGEGYQDEQDQSAGA